MCIHLHSVFCLALLVVMGCRGPDQNGAPVGNENPGPPPVITVTMTDAGYQAPDTLRAGHTSIRFVNETNDFHMAHLVKIEGTHSLDDLVDSYAVAVRNRSPRPEWMIRFGGPLAEPHSIAATVTQDLEAGLYAWICGMDTPDGTIHFTAREARALIVLPADEQTSRPTAPVADNIMRLLDYSFALEEPLRSGTQTLMVENLGPEPHEVSVAKLAAGMTIADFEAWFNDPQGPPPATLSGAVSALAPSLKAYLDLDLTPGSYVLFCFVTAPDGRPHIAHGMIQQVEVM